MPEAPRRCPLCAATTAEPRCPTDGMATLLRQTPPPDLGTLQPGVLLGGRHELKSAISRGGFGAVLRCQHIGTGQDVAVKVLALPACDQDIVLQRFFLEARATAGLTHPNTLQSSSSFVRGRPSVQTRRQVREGR